MHAHTTRSVRGRRMIGTFLLPAVGLGLLTACSGGATAENSEDMAITEEAGAKDSVEETCQGLDDLMNRYRDLDDELGARLNTVEVGDVAATQPMILDFEEDLGQLAADYWDLAADAEDQQLADATLEMEYFFREMSNGWGQLARIDVSTQEGDDEYRQVFDDFEAYRLELLESEHILEADDYIVETCGYDLDRSAL